MKKNKADLKWFRQPGRRLTVILILCAVCVSIFFGLYILIINSISRDYITTGSNTQQQYSNQLADALNSMCELGASEKDLQDYMAGSVPASGSSWAFLIKNHTVIFAKNPSTTETLQELKERDAFLKHLKEQNAIVTVDNFYVGNDSYTAGIITDEAQYLEQIHTHEVYLSILFATLTLIFIGAITALTGAWTGSDRKQATIRAELLKRNKEFEALEHASSADSSADGSGSTPIVIHHRGKSNLYKQYKFKFYLNARHAIYIDGVLGAMHPHTWEITLHVIKMQHDFVQFGDLEKKIEAFMQQYQDQELNSIPPFDVINPTLENCCDYFKEQISRILEEAGWLFLMIEMSETPSRSYVISMIDEE